MVFGNCGVLQEMTSTKGFVEMTGIDAETSQDIADVKLALIYSLWLGRTGSSLNLFCVLNFFRPSPAKADAIWRRRFRAVKCKPRKVCWSCWPPETALSSMTASPVSKPWAKVHSSSVNIAVRHAIHSL